LYRSDQKTSYNSSKSYPIPENPVRRDVIVVKNFGFVILAFRADNPGVWFLYSHPNYAANLFTLGIVILIGMF
jgi:iron transport multicopper oxidase